MFLIISSNFNVVFGFSKIWGKKTREEKYKKIKKNKKIILKSINHFYFLFQTHSIYLVY